MAKIKATTSVDIDVTVKKSGKMYEASCNCRYGLFKAASFTAEDAVQMIANSIREATDYEVDTEVVNV